MSLLLSAIGAYVYLGCLRIKEHFSHSPIDAPLWTSRPTTGMAAIVAGTWFFSRNRPGPRGWEIWRNLASLLIFTGLFWCSYKIASHLFSNVFLCAVLTLVLIALGTLFVVPFVIVLLNTLSSFLMMRLSPPHSREREEEGLDPSETETDPDEAREAAFFDSPEAAALSDKEWSARFDQMRENRTKRQQKQSAMAVLCRCATEAIEAKKYDEAEKICRRLLIEHPDQFDSFDAVGELREAQGQFQEAADNYSKALEILKHHTKGSDQSGPKHWENKRDRALSKMKGQNLGAASISATGRKLSNKELLAMLERLRTENESLIAVRTSEGSGVSRDDALNIARTAAEKNRMTVKKVTTLEEVQAEGWGTGIIADVASSKNFWIAYLDRNDGFSGIRESYIMLISRSTGEIEYEGGACDEG